ncbi:hypothetical protein LY90DRAFT_666616, partial [Neocallimastix californiae]
MYFDILMVMSEIIEKEHEEMEEKVVEDLSQLELTSDSEHSSDDYSTTTPIKSKKFNTVGELKKEMSKLGLSLKGNKEELKKRYKKYIKKQEEKEKNMHKVIKKVQPFKYYCVIDYEATCEEGQAFVYPNEIIEFPAVLLRSYTGEVESEFHEYVKPKNNPVLTKYCKELTGITQEQVDGADYFPEVLKHFEAWLSQFSDFPYENVCFVTDGPWDIRDFIQKQCVASDIKRPVYFYSWLNLRKAFKYAFRLKNQKRLNEMLAHIGLTFEGREHCGLDDTRNIARIVQFLLENSVTLKKNIEYNRA